GAGPQRIAEAPHVEPAVVADVDCAIRADLRSVRAAPRGRDSFDPTVAPYPLQRAADDFDHQHRPVIENDRPLRVGKAFRDHLEIELPHVFGYRHRSIAFYIASPRSSRLGRGPVNLRL